MSAVAERLPAAGAGGGKKRDAPPEAHDAGARVRGKVSRRKYVGSGGLRDSPASRGVRQRDGGLAISGGDGV